MTIYVNVLSLIAMKHWIRTYPKVTQIDPNR